MNHSTIIEPKWPWSLLAIVCVYAGHYNGCNERCTSLLKVYYINSLKRSKWIISSTGTCHLILVGNTVLCKWYKLHLIISLGMGNHEIYYHSNTMAPYQWYFPTKEQTNKPWGQLNQAVSCLFPPRLEWVLVDNIDWFGWKYQSVDWKHQQVKWMIDSNLSSQVSKHTQ